MLKHNVHTRSKYESGFHASTFKSNASGVDNAPRAPMRRLDPLFSQLSQLDLATSHFKDEYWMNRRQALVNLVQELTVLQKLYDGRPLDITPGDEALQSRAMELNTHLANATNFGDYSNAAKINLLYQLRRAVEIIFKKHFE